MALYSSDRGHGMTTASTVSRSSLYPPPQRSSFQYASPQLPSFSSAEVSVFELDSGGDHENDDKKQFQHLYVLPVLLLEFLALALTRAVLPGILLKFYDDKVYLVMGLAECVRGFLAFLASPLFGKISDKVGRRICLLVTVAGTCAPVCSLALMTNIFIEPAQNHSNQIVELVTNTSDSMVQAEPTEELSSFWSNWMEPSASGSAEISGRAITIFVVLFAVSGVFTSTFTLVFAYISDTVHTRDERVSAYGLALATFGLSFTVGPMAGGYISKGGGTHKVFAFSLILTLLDLLYIYAVLPESNPSSSIKSDTPFKDMSWSPIDSLRIIFVDPFLRRVGKVAFLYYTSVWAVVSTLILYAAKQFELGPERLGELMSALGLSTMIAEAVLVRIFVPMIGEKKSMQVGLISFALQCVILGVAYESWHLFVCVLFSMLGHLVYPSLTSLVSSSVEPNMVGEALGAINGIKALTEGIGPLAFGSLMTLSEKSSLPGWPYLIAALLAYTAFQSSSGLPDAADDSYIHELERKHTHFRHPEKDGGDDDDDDEYAGLLSDIDDAEESDRDTDVTLGNSPAKTMLPVTFASLMSTPQQLP